VVTSLSTETLTVTGTSNFTSITGLNLATFSGVVVQNNLTATGTISGITLTGTSVQCYDSDGSYWCNHDPYRYNRKLHNRKLPDCKCWYPCCQWECNGYGYVRRKWNRNFCIGRNHCWYAERNYGYRDYSTVHHWYVYFTYRNYHHGYHG
jgi:hypothetical protein